VRSNIHDIGKLLKVIQKLVELGNSVLIIEHNLKILKYADWIIDLGPEGGKQGGNLYFVAEVPQESKNCKRQLYSAILKEKVALVV
jgi:excinuclease ABC subunit A